MLISISYDVINPHSLSIQPSTLYETDFDEDTRNTLDQQSNRDTLNQPSNIDKEPSRKRKSKVMMNI